MVNGTMLEQLFAGNFGMPMGQPCLTEAAWTMADLEKAVARLKANKVAEDAELIAGGPVTLVADGAVDWGGAGNAETNYVQHVAERKKKQNQHPTFVQLLWSRHYTQPGAEKGGNFSQHEGAKTNASVYSWVGWNS